MTGAAVADGFADYAAARWPVLVRTALLLGVPAALAPEVVTGALSRLRRQWRGLVSAGDLDAETLDLVVAAWDDLRARDWWTEHPAEPTPAGLGALDDLDRSDRTALVLRHVGGLEVGAADDAQRIDPALWSAARALPVLIPAPGRPQLDATARRRRARRTKRAAVVAAALLAVVVVAVLAGVGVRSATGGDEERAEVPRALSRVPTDAGPEAWVTWYAAGQLHLGATAVDVRGVQAVVGAPGGAVYVDRTGRVVRVDPQGERLLLGRTDDPATLVASTESGLVGWVDATEPGRGVLTVVDGVDGAHRRTLASDLGADLRPVGLRGDRLYVSDGRRAYSWAFDESRGDQGELDGRGGVRRLEEPGLVSVTGQLAVFGPASSTSSSTSTATAASLRVTFLDPGDQVPPVPTWLEVGGDEVVLAPSGRLVLTRTKAGKAQLTSLSPRRDEPTGVFGYEVALATALGADDQIAYLVARAADRPKSGDFVRSTFTGTVTLRTCTLSVARHATECRNVAQVSGTDEMPLLAR